MANFANSCITITGTQPNLRTQGMSRGAVLQQNSLAILVSSPLYLGLPLCLQPQTSCERTNQTSSQHGKSSSPRPRALPAAPPCWWTSSALANALLVKYLQSEEPMSLWREWMLLI